jgi:hypothetical protein
MDITGIGSIADAAMGIVNKIWPDKTQAEKDQAALEMAQVMNEHNLVIGQVEVNKVEAASTNWFVAGWRPFVGWVCGFGLAYQFLFYPLLSKLISIIPLDISNLNTILMGMLGLGAMRTFEKVKNSEGNR